MEEFILKVRSNPCLWDSSSVFFRDNARKHATWESVAMECGMADVSEAKSIWKRLRDSHREAMRRRKIAQQTLAPWKYEDLMDFLLPQPNNIDNNGSNFTIEEEDNEEYPNIECEVSEDEDIKPNIVDVTIEPTNNPPIMEVNKRESFLDNLEEREKRRAEQNRQRSDLRKQLIDGNRNTEDDALTHLFTSLCQKTRTLPKHLQLRVQREIFESVTKAEEEALNYDLPEGSGSSETRPTNKSVESVNAQSKVVRNKGSVKPAKRFKLTF